MCDGPSSKAMSVIVGGPRPTMSVGTISRDLKEPEESEGSFKHLKALLKCFCMKTGAAFWMFSFNFMEGLAMGKSAEVGLFAWLMGEVGSLEVGISSS